LSREFLHPWFVDSRTFITRIDLKTTISRIPHYGHEYGRFYLVSLNYLRNPTCVMSQGDPVKSEKRSGTTPSGVYISLTTRNISTHGNASTLATDRGFKERVRENMLVRLLDAFVWRNHGKGSDTICVSCNHIKVTLIQIDKKLNNSDSRTFKG